MDLEQFLQAVVALWERQIKACETAKESQFGKTAQRLWHFLGKSYRQLYLEDEEDLGFAHDRSPHYKTRISKSAEAVAILVPWVLSQVPHRRVTPRRPPLSQELIKLVPEAAMIRQGIDAQDLKGAYLGEWFLNYVSGEYDLKREARTSLPEAFVKGRGILWHEMVEAAAGPIPSSQFESVDNVLVDADTVKLKDAGFVIRYRELSIWQWSEITGLPREYLRGQRTSSFQRSVLGDRRRSPRDGADVCGGYEIYSRVGIGHWLENTSDGPLSRLREVLDEVGRYVYLVIIPGVPFPVNLNPAQLSAAEAPMATELAQSLAWPIPFWADSAQNPWPFSALDFYPHQEDPWASSPLEPGLPMQIYLDHLYSFAMSRIRITSRNIALVAQSLEKAATEAIEAGADLTLVPVSGEPGVEFDRLFKMIEFPETNEDLWKIAAFVERAYERATGLDPRLYGAQGERQLRSAKEAADVEAHVSSRPDDYADATEDWLSAAGQKELQMARLMVDQQVVAPIFGERLPETEDQVLGPLTQEWMDYVHTDDPYEAAAQYVCRVEAGTARRQNKQKQMGDLDQTIQALGQPLLGLAMQGLPGPFNALIQMLGDAQGTDLKQLMIPEGLRMGGQGEEENPEEAI